MSGPLWPHGVQRARLPCPSPSPGVSSDSCPLSHWCHPTILSSVVPFSSCPQSFPASGSVSIEEPYSDLISLMRKPGPDRRGLLHGSCFIAGLTESVTVSPKGFSDSHSPDKSNGSGTVPCLVLLPVCIGSEQDKTTWVVLGYFWVTIMMNSNCHSLQSLLVYKLYEDRNHVCLA